MIELKNEIEMEMIIQSEAIYFYSSIMASKGETLRLKSMSSMRLTSFRMFLLKFMRE